MSRLRTFRAPTQSSRRTRNRPLRLEVLESREVPSAEYCALPPFVGTPEPIPAPKGTREPPFDLSQTFLLHSRPSANHVIYLDFNGHATAGTFWNSDFAGGASFTTPAFDPASNGAAFLNWELERIQYIWQRVCEDFLPFDVDVTTEEPGIERLRNTGGGDTQWGIRVVIGGSGDLFGSPGGIAYLNSFTWDSDTPCFVFPDNLANGHEKYTTDAISHEVGHTLGLHHDGFGTTEYYVGHGSGATGWAPIMGVGYYRQLTQWSPGDYSGA